MAQLLPEVERRFRRRRHYRAVFETEDGKWVLADLAKFCGAFDTSMVPNDPFATCFNEGSRRVYLRIRRFLDMTDDEIISLVNQAQDAERDDYGED